MKQYERKSMNNYYETCMNSIQSLLDEGKTREALVLIDEELRMPYVPEPYFTQFQSIRDSIRIDTSPSSKYYEDIEDLEEALRGNELLQQKAIISLERMNLRNELPHIKKWLADEYIEDWIKKQILFFLIDQSIDLKLNLKLKMTEQVVDTSQLENPFESEAYQACVLQLGDMLESENPSLLILCLGALEQRVLDAFPVSIDELKAEEILDTVNTYLYKV
ncbi:DUF3196 domain-containing protein [Erysipelothrix rhusiopathiae]|nr:DUF3196 domain-containing protein [Erysipelothrix sp. strain 2 (EsS2-6-Brazil)]MBK2404716.1 DUF3196 domain-containing protein [Erysipelothrix sp. strain 2 (EsS2-7-Brazil)]NBA01906.1 DUF3196 domain-containing protein [Erysipelothrix rhusiopathiae]